MRIDLHTHSNRSDGTDAPEQLVRKAAAEGLDVIALTDHDATTGWQEALNTAAETGVTVIPGIEISTRFDGKSIHVLGYQFDPDYQPLAAELEKVLDGRNDRLPRTIEALQQLGIDITIADVKKWSGDAAATGRPHVADALMANGVVATRDEAFDRYLMPGRPAYIDRYAIELFDAVDLVGQAGGVSVLAHPWSRGSDRVMTSATIAQLRAAGLAGIEVDHNDHDGHARAQLRDIAAANDLIITGSSDYHGAGKTGFDLGCNTTAVDQYQRLFGIT